MLLVLISVVTIIVVGAVFFALRLGISFKKRRNSAPTEPLTAFRASLSSGAMLKAKRK
jgi:hypothetical protein